MFECDCCGCCCRNLDKSELYADLDRGDGTCIYLVDNLCSIYNERPLLCRVDECYERYFCEFMEREEYYRLNKEECKKLKNMEE
jgi:Fe-S-cluster containining protein